MFFLTTVCSRLTCAEPHHDPCDWIPRGRERKSVRDAQVDALPGTGGRSASQGVQHPPQAESIFFSSAEGI